MRLARLQFHEHLVEIQSVASVVSFIKLINMDMFNFAKTVPEWMDQAFFEKVIRQKEKDPKAVVEDFTVRAGSKPGDNFASSLFRASVTFSSKFTPKSTTISIIIKTQMIAGFAEMSDFLKESPLFRNEMEMYGKVLPEVQALWSSVGDKDMLCPKLIYQSTEPVPVIILEDLSDVGFSVIEKPPADFEISKQIARRLAKFHAANFYLHHEQKLDYSEFSMNLFQNAMMVDMIFDQGLDAFIDVANELGGFEKFLPNLESFKDQFLDKTLKTYLPNRSDEGYNVLNHADFHVKNMLFKKHANDSIEDFLFIDFQISIYATPAIDLIYALYYFVSAENRQNHRDEFIAVYHKQFVESLKTFGYLKAPPSLIDLQVELLRNGNLEVLVSICMSIFFYFDFTTMTAEDMDMGEGSKRAKRRMYRETTEFLEVIRKELPRFLYNGFI